jgi:hypothetical protein
MSAEPITRSAAIKEFFSVPGHPVTLKEQREFMSADREGYRWVGEQAAAALGRPVKETA